MICHPRPPEPAYCKQNTTGVTVGDRPGGATKHLNHKRWEKHFEFAAFETRLNHPAIKNSKQQNIPGFSSTSDTTPHPSFPPSLPCPLHFHQHTHESTHGAPVQQPSLIPCGRQSARQAPVALAERQQHLRQKPDQVPLRKLLGDHEDGPGRVRLHLEAVRLRPQHQNHGAPQPLAGKQRKTRHTRSSAGKLLR